MGQSFEKQTIVKAARTWPIVLHVNSLGMIDLSNTGTHQRGKQLYCMGATSMYRGETSGASNAVLVAHIYGHQTKH